MARPRKGLQSRTDKIMFALEPNLLEDFKIVAFLDKKSMTEKLIDFITKETQKRQPEIQAVKEIQNKSK